MSNFKYLNNKFKNINVFYDWNTFHFVLPMQFDVEFFIFVW